MLSEPLIAFQTLFVGIESGHKLIHRHWYVIKVLLLLLLRSESQQVTIKCYQNVFEGLHKKTYTLKQIVTWQLTYNTQDSLSF